MTGFGRAEIINEDYKLTVELKSVNHRYLDLNIRMPKKFNAFEFSIRNLLKTYIQRGKVDVFITYEDYKKNQLSLKYNDNIAKEYLKYAKFIEDEYGISNDIRVSTLLRFPEVMSSEENKEDEEAIWELLSEQLAKASESFVNSRRIEGDALKADLISKLEYMNTLIADIEKRYPLVINNYRARLEEKIKEILDSNIIDEARIATELVIFSDKICVDEETVRLKSHISSTIKELDNKESVGRKLDFIAQEMNREANTILSKSNDLELSNIAIALKTEIEKVREQIQNIE